jgi:carboxyl-terminal processing protease
MRRISVLLSLVVLLSACSLIDLAGPTTMPSDAQTSSSMGAATTSSSAGEGECAADAPDIVLLCQAVDLIQRNYVDDIPDAQLVASGVEGLDTLPDGGTTGDLDCSITDAVVGPLCEAIDAADATPEEGVEAALTSMAFSLDPNSAYLDPVALQLAEDDTAGQVEGIGALVSAEDSAAETPEESQCAVLSDTCHLVIVSLFENSPADQAGVEPGDIIVSVDGMDVDGFHIDEVTELVRGPAGTPVVVGFERSGLRLDFEIVRAAIDIPVAEWEMVGDVGYLRLNLFTVNSDDQIEPALTELLDAGARAIVFDLRNNPGGALQAAIEITSEFLADGLVVVTQSPDSESKYEVTGNGLATDPDIPLWIVVNEGSASASEVTTGVLHERGRATVLGENTFGKNTVQQRFSLGNGGAMKLTIARWTTPGGNDFGQVGLTPDIDADFPVDMTPTEVVEQVLSLVG